MRYPPSSVTLAAAASAAAIGLCMLLTPLALHPVGWLLALAAGVGVGAAALLGAVAWHAYAHHRLTVRLRAASRPRVVAEVEVQVLPTATVPFVAGMRRPQIFCAPVNDRLAPDELRAVLLHERFHQLDWAPAKLVMLKAFASFIGGMPAGRAWLARRFAALEIAADKHAIEQGSSRGALARALLKLAPMRSGSVGIGFTSATDIRLRALLGEPAVSDGDADMLWVLAPILVAAACGLLVVVA